MKVFIHQPDASASTYYRCTLPLLHCYAPLSKEGIQLCSGDDIEQFDDCQAFVFTRLVDNGLLDTIRKVRNQGKRIVWQADDDLGHVPGWHSLSQVITKQQRDNWHHMADLADDIWAACPFLKILLGRPDKTKVVPTLIDQVLFLRRTRLDNLPADPYRFALDKPVRVLWYGSVSNDRDLIELLPAVEQLAKERRAEFVFWGYLPDRLSLYHRPPGTSAAVAKPRHEPFVRYLPPVPLRRFFHAISRLEPDIILCPLVDNIFNHSKNNVRYLEAALAGAAFVGTNLPPFEGVGPDEGVLVPPGRTEDWYEGVRALIENADRRRQLAANSRRAAEELSWQRAADVWVDAFSGLA